VISTRRREKREKGEEGEEGEEGSERTSIPLQNVHSVVVQHGQGVHPRHTIAEALDSRHTDGCAQEQRNNPHLHPVLQPNQSNPPPSTTSADKVTHTNDLPFRISSNVRGTRSLRRATGNPLQLLWPKHSKQNKKVNLENGNGLRFPPKPSRQNDWS
jgi:hypothetical protein